MKTSGHWKLSLIEFDEEGESLEPEREPRSVEECLTFAEELTSGELAGTGDGGDCFQLQYDAENAAILYMTPAGEMLRPQFTHRERSGDGVELFYCHCCGVQLGDMGEMLAECTARSEGFELVGKIIDGSLPESGEIQWVPLKPRRREETDPYRLG
jgi:hypothetical protein